MMVVFGLYSVKPYGVVKLRFPRTIPVGIRINGVRLLAAFGPE
jgi:hypothetical protein